MDVLRAVEAVVEQARWAAVEGEAVERLAERIAARDAPPPEWDAGLHPVGRDDAEAATLVLILDALNFCFWPLPGSTAPRWTIRFRGVAYDGYPALAASLRRAVEDGVPLTDPDFLARIDQGDVQRIFLPQPGAQDIPMIEARVANLREVGRVLRDRWNGTFATAIEKSGRSSRALVAEVIDALPSFRDVAQYKGHEVWFLKRAQILIADLHGAFGGLRLGAFDDLDQLTAFADYKVPQMLRQLGVLDYHPELAQAIRRYDLIPPGDEREVEIRAVTVWAVERLRRELARLNRSLHAFEIDWLLWHASQDIPGDAEPYHRTLTIYY